MSDTDNMAQLHKGRTGPNYNRDIFFDSSIAGSIDPPNGNRVNRQPVNSMESLLFSRP